LWITGWRWGAHYYIRAIFICERLGIREPVILLIDTGASTTTFFAEDIGLSTSTYQALPPATTVMTLGGPQRHRRIPYEAQLVFATDVGRPHTVELGGCDVISRRSIGIERPLHFQGILGMDIINSFRRWSADGRYIVFET